MHFPVCTSFVIEVSYMMFLLPLAQSQYSILVRVRVRVTELVEPVLTLFSV